MIKQYFELGGEIVVVGINRNNLTFYDSSTGTEATIEGLRLSKEGVIKEFPDLKDNPQWKQEAINRFKKFIKAFDNEKRSAEYIKDELVKCGYKLQATIRNGFRPKKEDKR